MEARRLENAIRLQRAYSRGLARIAGRPLEAYVEVAARCNLACRMCPITVDPRYAPGAGRPFLSEEVFRRLEELAPTLERAYLFGLGEPTLNPHLPEYVRRLHAAGVEVWVTTNATRIDERRAEALAAAGLDRATVSIDGATKATYERIRVRGVFEEAVRGIRALAAARRRWGRPRVFLSAVAMRSNLAEWTDLVELCADAGGEGIFFEELYDWTDARLHENFERESLRDIPSEEVDRRLEAARLRAQELGLEWSTRLQPAVHPCQREPGDAGDAGSAGQAVSTEVPALPWACSEPWTTLNVTAAGDVRTCCFNDTVLGNLGEETASDVWNGSGYRELRRAHAERRIPSGCEVCVRDGRMKQSAHFITGRTPPSDAAREDARNSFELEYPADGDPVADPLVLVGRGTGGWLGRRNLPELFIDDTWIGPLTALGRMRAGRFAGLVEIPFVVPGRHRLSLRTGDGGAERWRHRFIHVHRTGDPDSIAALDRATFAVALSRGERRPRLRVDGAASELAFWSRIRTVSGPTGVAAIATGALDRGPHDVELAFPGGRVHRRRLVRLDPRPDARGSRVAGDLPG